jgi:transcriptional regulator with XRE-family HTH domain
MVNWVGAENTGIPYALALALRGKSQREIARETGIAESSLSEENMWANWAAVDKHILDALALALRRKPIKEIVRETGVPASSLYSIRKHGPYEHRNWQRL